MLGFGLGLTTAALMGGNSLAAIIAALFGAGEQGAIWLPEPKYLFQDRAGTTPVTAPGQSVGRRMDVSGRSNYLVAINDAARGIYGVEPFNGRRNLLTWTEEFDDPTWLKVVGGVGLAPAVTANAGAAPNGIVNADRLVLNAVGSTSSDISRIERAVTYAAVPTTLSLWLRSFDGNTHTIQIDPAVAGIAATVVTVTPSWQRFTLSGTPSAASANLRIGLRGTFTGTGADILIWGAQLEIGPVATPYQRVASQYDVTEAGVPSLHYIQYDGADDGYVSPVITPGTDKAQVFAGVRKLSDAVTGTLIELSSSGANGSVGVFAPLGAAANYEWRSRGTALAQVTSGNIFAAPISNILTCLGDISGDTSILRINGVEAVRSSSDQGTGNYMAYPIYVGRRGCTTLPFNGRDYGLIARFGPNLSPAQIAQVERYLALRTGVSI